MKFVTDEVMKDLKKSLHQMAISWDRGVCKGQPYTLTGEKFGDGIHGGCHAWVVWAYALRGTETKGSWDYRTKYSKKSENFVILNCHTAERATCGEESVLAILHWFAKESPFRKYFLNADDDESLKDGAILLCGPDGATLSEAMWIFKVLRYSTEGSKSLDVWNALYKAGVDPFLAILICTIVGSVEGTTFGVGGVRMHVEVFRGCVSYKKLLKHEFDKQAEHTGAFFKGVEGDFTAKITGFCKPVQISDGWGGMTDSTSSAVPDFVDSVKEWEEQLRVKYLTVREPKAITRQTVFLDEDM